MIWIGIIVLIASFLTSILDMIHFSVAIPDGIFSSFGSFIDVLFYLFPVRGLAPILGVSLVFYTVRAGIAFIRFIKGFIPTMGG